MVKVGIWGSLSSATGGQKEVEVEAANIRQLLTKLEEAYPGLQPAMARGISVSIDGKIYRDDWFQKIPEGAEVYVLPRQAGG